MCDGAEAGAARRGALTLYSTAVRDSARLHAILILTTTKDESGRICALLRAARSEEDARIRNSFRTVYEQWV